MAAVAAAMALASVDEASAAVASVSQALMRRSERCIRYASHSSTPRRSV
jgi:hypothetical protein